MNKKSILSAMLVSMLALSFIFVSCGGDGGNAITGGGGGSGSGSFSFAETLWNFTYTSTAGNRTDYLYSLEIKADNTWIMSARTAVAMIGITFKEYKGTYTTTENAITLTLTHYTNSKSDPDFGDGDWISGNVDYSEEVYTGTLKNNNTRLEFQNFPLYQISGSFEKK